jgi:hypothetical protein
MSKNPEGYCWMLTFMDEYGQIPFAMNCTSTAYSELSAAFSNLADVRDERGIKTELITIDNPGKDAANALSSLRVTSLPTFKFEGEVIEVSDEASCAAAFERLDAELAQADLKVAGLDVEYVTDVSGEGGAEFNHCYADVAQICVRQVCVLVFFDAPALTAEGKAALYLPFQKFLANPDITKVLPPIPLDEVEFVDTWYSSLTPFYHTTGRHLHQRRQGVPG